MNELYNGPPVAPEDVISVYVIFNGSLGMSPRKMAAQAFHCGRYVGERMEEEIVIYGEEKPWVDWGEQGYRVVVRVAETPYIFGRVMHETLGIAQRDEGLTEVERGSITAWVTIPYRRDSVPKILTHKKCQLL